MLETWARLMRSRGSDEERALRGVRGRAEREVREALAGYDAFVRDALSIEEGLVLGTARSATKEEIPLRLPWDAEYAHWLVQGGTGTGKTTWVASLLAQELEAGRPFGVLDCKGDLYAMALRMVGRSAPRERVVIVNPFSDALVPLNVCRPLPGSSPEVQAYEVTLALSRLFDRSLGLHMENILRHLLLLLMESDLTLVEAPQVLEDEVLRGVLAQKSRNEAVKHFFLGTYEAIPQVSKDALLSRLGSLLLPENMRLMLGADDLLDLRGVLDRGDYLFVFLGKGPGVPEEQVEVLGSLFLQLLFQATYARGSGERRGYLIAADEFFHLLEAPGLAKRFETALTSVRSFGLSLMLIHHNFAQLPVALREIVLGNCDLMTLFRTSGRNAEHFGDFLPEVDPETFSDASAALRMSRTESRRRQLEALQRLPDRHAYWYDRRKPYRALKLRVPDVDFPVRAREEESIVTTATPSRTALRAQIEARKRRLHDLIRPPVRITRSATDGADARPADKNKKPTLG
ncbi:MAG: DUF853 family protein [Candidatus Rokubacteria bacterium]|nr:DUF853 family protein [Candidatus Rokubacteria bacterium]